MTVVRKWFRALRFSYWRRCRACSLRGSKCLCRRPSLHMEQIFFIEERKNKGFGARNFSHVSDTAVSSSTCGSGSGSGTMSFGPEYGPGEFYHATQQQSTSTALVRRNSGAMVPMNSSQYSQSRPSYSQDDMHCSYSSDYQRNFHNETARGRSARRQLPASTTVRPEDSSMSLQVYNRKQQQQRVARPASRSSARLNGGDSLVVRSTSTSSVRPSTTSDRMSIDNNTGSYNPSRFYGASYAPSLFEDDDVQDRLNGLLLMPSPASSTSTILERSKYRQYY
jgi:hypothetical protein